MHIRPLTDLCIVGRSDDPCRHHNIPVHTVVVAILEEQFFLWVVEIWLEMLRLRVRLARWGSDTTNVYAIVLSAGLQQES